MPFDSDFDIKITLSGTTHRFRLLQQEGTKAWSVRELAPNPNLALAGQAEEGFPPNQLLPFKMEDWSFGAGLLKFTPQIDRPGHFLRYADGFGIDTTDPRVVKHGPDFLSDVGTLNSTPLMGLMFDDKIWFLTTDRLYNWDGSTLTSFWTNPDGTVNTHMAVHGGHIFVAASNTKYWFTDGSTAPASRAFAATQFLSLGKQLWRLHTVNKLSSSTDPEASSPTWASDIDAGPGETVTSLFSISGLLGVATESSFFIIDSDGDSIELDNRLSSRRSTNAHTIAAASGSSVWFANENRDDPDVFRLVALGYEEFDVQKAGPFHGNDDLPVNAYDPNDEILGFMDILHDLEFVYVVARRGSNTYIYKGKELARNIFAWSPILKHGSNATTMAVIGKLSDDSAPIIYFNGGGDTVKRFSTQWDEYTSDWELITPYFTANLESWDKMWYVLRAYLEAETNAKVTASYRVNNDSAWTTFGSTGVMDSNGNNNISVTSPASGFRVQLKFAGNTTNSDNKVDMHSFMLEGILRPEERSTLDFTVLVENKTQATFLHNLRKETSSFPQITDRLGTTWNVFVLPGFPVESEVTDEARKGILRAFRIVAQSVD